MWKTVVIKYLFKIMTSDIAKELIIDLLNWLVKKTKTDVDDKLVENLIEIWHMNKSFDEDDNKVVQEKVYDEADYV